MNSKSGIRINKYIIGLILLFLISALSDYNWLSQENQPPSWDEALHLTKSLQYYNMLTALPPDIVSILINIDDYYPPFYHLSTTLTYSIFGTSMDSAIAINILYFLILLFSTYGIGKSLHSKQAGLIAAALISLFPVIVGMRRFYLIEPALISMVTLSIYLLLLTDHFKIRKYSLLFGTSVALALLTKWTAIFFIIGPLLAILYEYYKYRTESAKPVIINIILAVILTLSISLIWYYPHFSDVYKQISWGNEFWGASEGDPEVLTIASISYYFRALINSQISLLFFIPLIAGLIHMFRSKNSNLFLLSWIVLPYIIMTLLRNKNDRYTLPSIVAFAIISAMWLATINPIKIRNSILAILLILGSSQLLYLSLGNNPTANIQGINILPQATYGLRSPIDSNWQVEPALATISADIRTNPRIQGRPAFIGVLPDWAQVNGLTYQYYAYTMQIPAEVIPVPYFESLEPFAKNLLNFDYLILKTGENSGESRKQLVADMQTLFYTYSGPYYIPLANYTLPDNTELQIYKNNITPPPQTK